MLYALSRDFAALWTVAHQAPLSVKFPRQEYRSGLPFPSLGDLPNPGTEPLSPVWQADSLPLSHQGSPHTVNPFQTQHRNTLKVQSASPDFPVHQAFPTPAS